MFAMLVATLSLVVLICIIGLVLSFIIEFKQNELKGATLALISILSISLVIGLIEFKLLDYSPQELYQKASYLKTINDDYDYKCGKYTSIGANVIELLTNLYIDRIIDVDSDFEEAYELKEQIKLRNKNFKRHISDPTYNGL